MPNLFEPLTIRSLTLRNRIVVSPMCQYSSTDGIANDWHMVHLGSRAVGGAGLILTEDTAVLEEGRITYGDLGIWQDAQIEPLSRIARFVHQQGAAFGIQLGYAGRKGSTTVPWQGGRPQGEGRALTAQERAWSTLAPSPLPFGGSRSQVPQEMTLSDIRHVQDGFVKAARRADLVGADVIELHAGWGYIFQQFYSPIVNHRTDEYGGSFQNRIRFMLETVQAIREVWPAEKPLFARIALSDWLDGGWTIDDAIALAAALGDKGVDLIDGISGAVRVDSVHPNPEPLMHVPLISRLRHESKLMTGANFGIETPKQADKIIHDGAADVVVLGRAMLRDPYWACHAAQHLGHDEKLLYPDQYEHWLTGRTSQSAKPNTGKN